MTGIGTRLRIVALRFQQELGERVGGHVACLALHLDALDVEGLSSDGGPPIVILRVADPGKRYAARVAAGILADATVQPVFC